MAWKTYGIVGEVKSRYLKETSDRKSEHTVETAFSRSFRNCARFYEWSNIRKVDILGLDKKVRGGAASQMPP